MACSQDKGKISFRKGSYVAITLLTPLRHSASQKSSKQEYRRLAASNDFLWWCLWTASTGTTTKNRLSPQGTREGQTATFETVGAIPAYIEHGSKRRLTLSCT